MPSGSGDGLAVKCCQVTKLTAVGVFQSHVEIARKEGKVPVMVHQYQDAEPRVTMLWSDFVRLYLGPSLEVPRAPR